MKYQKSIYFIGWDYASPDSIALKNLLAHPLSPWRTEAIVHDEVYVPAVDGIRLITTREFLEICENSPDIHMILSVKHPVHQKLWQRRAKDYRITIVDEGEIFQSTCQHLQATSGSMDLGIMQIPTSMSTDCIEALNDSVKKITDGKSQEILRAYILFLKSGFLEAFRPHTKVQAENPLTRPTNDNWLLSTAWGNIEGPALAWEFSAQRTSFLEQAMLLGSGSLDQWSYAFTAPDAAAATHEDRHLRTLFQPFGITPYVTHLSPALDNRLENQVSVSQTVCPEWKNSQILAHINVPHPFSIVSNLAEQNNPKNLLIRLGHSPNDLLLLLQNFAPNFVSLRCDRPGPLGLHAHLKFHLP